MGPNKVRDANFGFPSAPFPRFTLACMDSLKAERAVLETAVEHSNRQ